jgi:hypothetical protein
MRVKNIKKKEKKKTEAFLFLESSRKKFFFLRKKKKVKIFKKVLHGGKFPSVSWLRQKKCAGTKKIILKGQELLERTK